MLPSVPPGSADGAAPTERVAALRVGPWIVERELGRGAAGIVYQARHPELGVRAALKLLPLLDPHDLARVEREAQALARLAHPGLVRLLEAGRVERGIYLALELVEGPTLHERVRREGPLPPREAARVLEALARACEHVHRAGVVHRDIKPANVLLPPGGHPRLIDFGLVRAETPGTASLTATGTLLGTPGFMSPEQIQALPVDVRSDVYGLGATLYFALTGCSPFEGTDALKVIKAQLQQAPERPGALRVGIPAALERVCLRCLERDPQRRFPSALALAQALHASAGEGPRTLRGPALAAGAILALSAVASGLVLVRGRTAPTRPAATGRVPAPAPVATEGRAAAPEPPLSEAPAPEPPAPEPPVPEPPPPDWRQEGVVAVGEGRTEDALRAFDRALEADPQDLVALTKRASLRWGQGDLQGAREDLDRALARDERDPYLWSQSSGLYLMSGDGERCEADATRAIELDPDGASAYLNRSSARSLRGDLTGALADLDAYLQRQPGPAPIYLARAQLRVQVGDLTGALADHERALALAPDDPDALWGRGALRLQRGDLPGSLADLERLRAVLPPGDPRRGQVEELLRQFGR